MSGENYLAMSDEDFIKLPELQTGVVEETTSEVVPAAEEVTAPVVTEVTPEVIEPEKAEPEATEEKPEVEKPEVKQTPEEKAAADAAEAEKKEGEPEEQVAPDYAAFYNKIIAPLKANGKTIDIKSEDDVIRLMQMGAGFGRKMQDIQPHLKTLRFLEANNLLGVDQKDLAFLVDLRNKNPDAIKKLVKDAGIDPLDFNNEEEVKYTTTIPEVSDQQVAFAEALDNLNMVEGGNETIRIANRDWDAKSHEKLMEEPSIIGAIHEQRMNGIYDRIVREMDRQKALGNIPHSTPFLAAYKHVGDHLHNTNGFADLVQEQKRPVEEQVAPTPTPQLLETRAAAPKSSVKNSAQAKAAAAPKTTPRTAQPFVNPLAMSDEEFTAKYGNGF